MVVWSPWSPTSQIICSFKLVHYQLHYFAHTCVCLDNASCRCEHIFQAFVPYCFCCPDCFVSCNLQHVTMIFRPSHNVCGAMRLKCCGWAVVYVTSPCSAVTSSTTCQVTGGDPSCTEISPGTAGRLLYLWLDFNRWHLQQLHCVHWFVSMLARIYNTKNSQLT